MPADNFTTLIAKTCEIDQICTMARYAPSDPSFFLLDIPSQTRLPPNDP